MARSDARERARRLAAGQGGRIAWAQMRRVGLSEADILAWERRGDLIRTRLRVYAVGIVRTDTVAMLWEALLYAGPGACLTAGSGAHCLGWVNYPPRDAIVVATPRRVRSEPGITVLRQRQYERVVLPDGLAVAPQVELMLDLAAAEGFNVVRHALGVLDFTHVLDVGRLLGGCRRGRPGSRQLRRALQRRLPGLARCKSQLEIDFLIMVEAARLAIPCVNARLHGVEPDMWWPELNLVIELDGVDNHGSPGQQRDDAAKMAMLRAQGLTVIRLNWFDVHRHPDRTLAMLCAHGIPLAPRTTLA